MTSSTYWSSSTTSGQADPAAPPLESAFAAAPAEPVAVEADEPASSESLASAFAAASEPALADTA